MRVRHSSIARRYTYAAIGVDESGRTAIDLGVSGVPETFILSADGVIRYKHVGPILPEQVATFKERLETARQSVGLQR